ncbi:MAG TPA: shikimate kinase [Streptosporangiales bacterium]
MSDETAANAEQTGPVVVLVGPPGAGKTTVGRRLAERLGVGFLDTDAAVEERAGKPVAEIFVVDGEPAFRRLEHEAVATALAEHDGVLSLGGGAVLDPATRDLLRAHRVVFLDVDLGAAAQRVGLDTPRPLLIGNPRATLRQQLADRRPHYLEVATAVVATSALSPAEVVEAVLDVVRGERTEDEAG